MTKYEVKLEWYETVEVEADSEDEAIQAAKQQIIDQHGCNSNAEDAIEFMNNYINDNHYAVENE